MPITEKQVARRRDYIGASDIAAIMGLSQYRNAYDIWASKTGKLPDYEASEAAQTGNALERGVLELAEPSLGKMILNQFRVCEGTKIGSNCDALVVESGRPVEAKIRSRDDNWGEPNTDEVPDDIILQCTAQMLCTKTDLCHIAALLTSRGLRVQLFFVPFNKIIGDEIVQVAGEFWDKYVLKDTPPPILPSMDTIKRMRREPKSVIELPNGGILVAKRQEAAEIKKAAELEFDAADRALKAALGTNEKGVFDGGSVSYFSYNKKGYEVKPCEYRKIQIKLDKKEVK
jgi:putative phage-type endonuclease